jgi:hypothetical protein
MSACAGCLGKGGDVFSVPWETSFYSKQSKLEPNLISFDTLSETLPLLFPPSSYTQDPLFRCTVRTDMNRTDLCLLLPSIPQPVLPLAMYICSTAAYAITGLVCSLADCATLYNGQWTCLFYKACALCAAPWRVCLQELDMYGLQFFGVCFGLFWNSYFLFQLFYSGSKQRD